MIDCIVTVLDPNTEGGTWMEPRGCVEAMKCFTSEDFGDIDFERVDWSRVLRSSKIWMCNYHDRTLLAEALSQEWVGHEIKIFNLSEIITRGVGDIKRKEISKAGVLPA